MESPEQKGKIFMDVDEFESCSYQRVYQYIKCHENDEDLDSFSYDSGSVVGTPQDCICLLLECCGVKEPSWAEIRHFVKFLDRQLESCEGSVFTKPEIIGDIMTGLKGFIFKFMIHMSRDFSTSSLRGEVALEMNELRRERGISTYQISEKKLWEQKYVP
jgi:hypothetical protein